jgi:tetratricopeptide (TPR) repeat protein
MNEESIFIEALQKDLPEERAAFLDVACAGNKELRRSVEMLLRAHEKAGHFLQRVPEDPRTTDQATQEGPGTLIGQYKLLELIGEGGMGAVWMAEQREPVQRKVALKIIKAGMDTQQVVARFEAERQALALMEHPNIAKVFDGGTTASGRPYFVMELVKGVPITRYCDERRLTPRERLELLLPVCQAIQHAHQKGIIHRDLKPANVLVAPYDGEPVPKVIDFGVAKAIGQRLTEHSLYTGFGTVVGTLEYMSPEQAELNNRDIDTRSDIYALGVLLYELLTGTTPLRRERLTQVAFTELLRAIREEEPPRPSTRLSESKETLPSISAQRQMEPARLTKLVRGELDWIVMKALDKDRNRRYETANGFAMDVQRYLADEPVQACPPSMAYRFRKFARRNKARLAIVGLVLFFLILLGGGAGWVVRDREARRAETAQQAHDSLTRARKWLGENKLALARRELAAARERIGSDRAVLGSLAAEVEAFETEVGQLERFLDLVEQAHEAEFPPPVAEVLQADSGGMALVSPQGSSPEREPAKAVPFLLQALSCYGVLERDDWSARLENGFLEPDQVGRVRQMAYEVLLWLADDVGRREVNHLSGRKMIQREAAQKGLDYLRHAEATARPTTAFYLLRARFLKALGQQGEARRDGELARHTPEAIALDHVLLAQAARDARDKAQAVQHYQAALRVEPTHYWSLLNLGGCLNDLGQGEQDFVLAVDAFTGCILKHPDHARPYLGRGYAYLKLERPKEAEADCRQALRLRPDYPDAHSNLGVALAAQGKHAEAEAEYRQALRLRPDYVKARFNLGTALGYQKKHAEAEAEFREALRLRSDLPEAQQSLGVALNSQGKHAEAEALCRKVLRLRPDFPEVRVVLGDALNAQKKHAEAEAECRQALHLRPDHPGAHISLANALRGQGKYAEAEAEYREALRLHPGIHNADEVHYNLGNALTAQRKHAEAEAEYRKALRLRPGWPDAHTNLGNALGGQGKHAEAAAELREALRLRPDHIKARVNLAIALNFQGKYAAAEAECRKALRQRSDFPEAHIAHFQLGKTLTDQGKHAEAEAEFREALRLRPDFRAGRVLVGFVLCRQGKPAAALRFYTDSFAADPKLADDVRFQNRYNAACCAALVGCGQAKDAAQLDDAERARLRRQALDWLRADLAAWRQLLEKQPNQARARVQQNLRFWQQDDGLAGVRGDALAKLPEAERQAWQQLWADVDETLKRVNPKDTNETKKRPK